MIPIVNKVLLAYPSTTVNLVNYLPMSYMIMLGIFMPVCGFISEKYGLRKAFLLGTGMMLIGVTITAFINFSFTYMVVGQTIIGLF
jgi:MFS family permease